MKKITFLGLWISLAISCTASGPVFYGMTTGGGGGYGTIFNFNPVTNVETVLWGFEGDADGEAPEGNLIYNPANGLYYGLTSGGGGSTNGGTIFSFNPATNRDSVLYSFGITDGLSPYGNLVYDAGNGLYYGMANLGGTNTVGTIFSFNASTNAENVVWNFGNANDGQSPDGSLVYDTGNQLLYGLTFQGGSYGFGVIFSLNTSTNRDSVLWNFGSDTDGQGPHANLVYTSATGLFYGTTTKGGSNSYGTIFSFDPANNTEHVLWSFGNGTDGQTPLGDLVYDAANELYYGMTFAGGTNGTGTIFSFNASNNTEHVVWNFGNGLDGYNPNGNLYFDAASGLFYGLTTGGGAHNVGTIFSFNPATNTDSMLWSFGATDDGTSPYGSLTAAVGAAAGIVAVKNIFSYINIFPNPSSGNYSLSGLTPGQTVEVYNDLGQKINSFIATGPSQQLNISDQANGVYLLQILSKDGAPVEQRKVLKVD